MATPDHLSCDHCSARILGEGLLQRLAVVIGNDEDEVFSEAFRLHDTKRSPCTDEAERHAARH
jgi:hypothetical protein